MGANRQNTPEFELVFSWLLWHYLVKFLQHDIPLVESAELRFSGQYGAIMRQIGRQAFAKEKAASLELRRNGIKILGEKWDQGELFLMWQYKGETELLRIYEGKLRFEVQKRINELILKSSGEKSFDGE